MLTFTRGYLSIKWWLKWILLSLLQELTLLKLTIVVAVNGKVMAEVRHGWITAQKKVGRSLVHVLGILIQLHMIIKDMNISEREFSSKSPDSHVSLINIFEPRLWDVRKIQSTWQAFAALRPLGLRMLGGIGDLVKWSRNLEYVRAYWAYMSIQYLRYSTV